MFPLFTTRCLHVRHDVRDPQRRKWELWARILSGNFAEMTTSTPFRDLLHAANLRHGTGGFTSPLKEGVLRIFSPLKIRMLRPGLNPRTWVLKASTLPLDHRSHVYDILLNSSQNEKYFRQICREDKKYILLVSSIFFFWKPCHL